MVFGNSDDRSEGSGREPGPGRSRSFGARQAAYRNSKELRNKAKLPGPCEYNYLSSKGLGSDSPLFAAEKQSHEVPAEGAGATPAGKGGGSDPRAEWDRRGMISGSVATRARVVTDLAIDGAWSTVTFLSSPCSRRPQLCPLLPGSEERAIIQRHRSTPLAPRGSPMFVLIPPHGNRLLRLLVLALVLVASSSVLAQEGVPGGYVVGDTSTLLRVMLREDLIAHWYPRALDKEHGGFHQNFARDWSPRPDESKFLVYQARMTWTAAAYAEFDKDRRDEYLGYARHGLAFLDTVMRDKEHGGFHWILDAKGRVDPRLGDDKHVYGISFVIYAASKVREVAGDELALQGRARRLRLARGSCPRHPARRLLRGPEARRHADRRLG